LEENTGPRKKDGERTGAAGHPAAAGTGDKALPQRARDLMMAALGLFARRDFSAVTIKDIAKVAGVNTALIYYYFDNKEDLFRATLDYAVERALENYRRLGERHSDPVDLINDWFDNHAELSEPIRELVKIMLDYRTARTQLRVIDDIIKLFYDEECRIISESVRRGIAMGVFRRVDPEAAANIASTHLDGIMVRSMIHRELDVVAAIAQLKTLFFEHLGYGAAKAAGHAAAPRIANAG
jgi:AcrR family transcriptional regulator